MSSNLETKIGLPKLPPKATVRLDHLAFREPGDGESKGRQKNLEDEVKKQEDNLQKLKLQQEELRKRCRKEIDIVKQSQSRSQREAQPRKLLSIHQIQDLLEETVAELDLATSQEDDQETLKRAKRRDSLMKTDGDIEKQTLSLEHNSLEIKMVDHEIEEVQGNIKKSKQELAAGENARGETGGETGGEMGVQTEEKKGGGIVGGTEGDTEVETGVEKEEEKVKRDQAKKREKQDQQVRLKQQEQELERQKKMKMERDLQELETKLRNLGDRKSALMAHRRRAERMLKSLKEKRNDLEKSPDNSRAIDPEQEEQERHRREHEEEKQRMKELERLRGRERSFRALREDLLEMQHYLLRRSRRMIDRELFDADTDPNEFREPEEILKKVEVLEALLTEVVRLKQKLAQVQALKVSLQMEIDSEKVLRLREKSISKQVKDHLSGNGLKIYEPLEENQIRLLILWPAPMDCYPLICSLRKEALDQNPKPRYAALSYYWGTDLPDARLYLLQQDHPQGLLDQNNWGYAAKHAIRIRIRNNLFRALLRLRRQNEPVALWVDVMCINQEDKTEKTKQLHKMVDVYARAENVCIWLGEADSEGHSDDAMDFIPDIMDFAVLDTLAKDKEQAKKWYALSELMRDRWFSRRWIVQEISLAKKASVHCGAKSVQWLDFVDAVSILVSNQARIKTLFDFSTWREGPHTMGEVQSFGASILLEATSRLFLRKEDGNIVQPVKSLESLVTSLKTFDASDQRDIIYSLVSIASDTYNPESFSPRRDEETKKKEDFPVDYSRSEIDVYKDFTKFCINSSQSLDIICRHWAMPVKKKGDEKEEYITLPSWIPLLTDSEFGEPGQVYGGRKNGDNLVGPVGQRRYNAAGDTIADVQLEPEAENDTENNTNRHPSEAQKDGDEIHTESIPTLPSSLRAKGFILARIEQISLRNTAGLILRESLQMGGWTGIQKNPESVPDRIWRTLIADRDPDGHIPPTWYQRACLRCLEMADTFNNGDLNIGQLLQGNSDMLGVYLTRVRNTIWNRKFFTAKIGEGPRSNLKNGVAHNGLSDTSNEGSKAGDTSNGGSEAGDAQEQIETTKSNELFGLCPGKTEKEDLICILYGCSVPIILREKPSLSDSPKKWFELIGEAYVHGKMDGEAIADYRDGLTLGRKEEYFELR